MRRIKKQAMKIIVKRLRKKMRKTKDQTELRRKLIDSIIEMRFKEDQMIFTRIEKEDGTEIKTPEELMLLTTEELIDIFEDMMEILEKLELQ